MCEEILLLYQEGDSLEQVKKPKMPSGSRIMLGVTPSSTHFPVSKKKNQKKLSLPLDVMFRLVSHIIKPLTNCLLMNFIISRELSLVSFFLLGK